MGGRIAKLWAGALVLAAAAAPAAHGSGMTTHAFMADKARDYVQTAELKKLLGAHRSQLLAGGAWPDAGYAVSSYPTGAFGEATHWERFVNAFARQLRERCGPAELTDPTGPCAPQVSFLMGIAAHGVGDEMWDWMFEPQMPDQGEDPTHPIYQQPGFAELGGLPPGSLANTPEYAMDIVAIVRHARVLELPLSLPPTDDLIAAYEAVHAEESAIEGRGPTLGQVPTRDAILAGHTVVTAAIAAERAAATFEYARIALTMPWSAAHMYDESGGVVDVAQAAAGYMESLWRKLTGEGHPAPRVVAVHPEPGERGVPTAWPSPAGKDFSGPASGLAENRIIAVISNALPYPGTGLASLAPGAFELIDEETGEQVPAAPGHPTPGPYGSGDGTHSMLFYPAADLKPCHWYKARLTTAVVDHAGAPLAEPYEWRFQTRAASDPAPEGCLPGKDPQALPGLNTSGPATLGPTVTDALAKLVPGLSDGHGHRHKIDHHQAIALLGAALRARAIK